MIDDAVQCMASSVLFPVFKWVQSCFLKLENIVYRVFYSIAGSDRSWPSVKETNPCSIKVGSTPIELRRDATRVPTVSPISLIRLTDKSYRHAV